MLLAEFLGTLGADAEVKKIGNDEYTTFSVATTPDYRKKDETVWVSVMMNGVNMVQYLNKGTRVFVRGRLKTSAWANKQGEPQAGLSVFSTELQLLGGGERQEESKQKSKKQQKGDLPF